MNTEDLEELSKMQALSHTKKKGFKLMKTQMNYYSQKPNDKGTSRNLDSLREKLDNAYGKSSL